MIVKYRFVIISESVTSVPSLPSALQVYFKQYYQVKMLFINYFSYNNIYINQRYLYIYRVIYIYVCVCVCVCVILTIITWFHGQC